MAAGWLQSLNALQKPWEKTDFGMVTAQLQTHVLPQPEDSALFHGKDQTTEQKGGKKTANNPTFSHLLPKFPSSNACKTLYIPR